MMGKAATPEAPGLRDDAGGGESNPPFLKLPPELRNTIYRYIVVNSTPIQLYLGDVDRRRQMKPQSEQDGRRPLLINVKTHPQPLALTCRTLYSEVRSIYMVENTFCLSNISTTERLHVDYITQFRRMMGLFAKKIKKVNIDYRSYVKVANSSSSDEEFKQIWVKLSVSLNDSGCLKVETRAGCYADLCHCGLLHLAKNHSARASDTKLLNFLEAMFKVASRHCFEDILCQECKKCGRKRRLRQSPMLQRRKTETLVVW
ncbi:hypothetical protein D0864_09188 [Hortaea werneckii]|uniref:DUF7730 domain-containing protein n=1 Tax=Hortaea werneckii TaxID=91943 RepID=A0A3M7EQT0_HORWE|nr:hypothetical protein D0864_09188 [Hortaea werneckii]